jgi:hypothetical protein
MVREELVERIDPALMTRLATLSPGAQRWLKTAVQAIRTMPSKREDDSDVDVPPPSLRRRPTRLPAPKPAASPPGLEDVITGKARLEDLDQYPELAGELEGMGEIIDMLRGLGEARRKRGEQILREEILGQPPSDDEPAEDDEDDFGF